MKTGALKKVIADFLAWLLLGGSAWAGNVPDQDPAAPDHAGTPGEVFQDSAAV